MSIKVLHVEDHEGWQEIILEIIETIAGEYEISSFDVLYEAKKAAAEQDFDIFICDGTVQEWDDGLDWACELQDQGKKVILVSMFGGVDRPDFEPVFNKNGFDSEGFIKAIEELAS